MNKFGLGEPGLFNHTVRGKPLASFANPLTKINHVAQLLFRQRVGLFSIRKERRPDKERARQVRQHPLATAPSGVVSVKEQGNEPHTALAQERNLLGRHRPTHESGNRNTKRMQSDRRPKAFNEHDVLAFRHAVQVKEHPAFLEFRRQLVALLTVRHVIAGPASGIGDKLALPIVNRDTDPPGHAATGAEAEPEQFDELGAEAAPLKIRVRGIELQREGERWVYWLVR
jgi:hypothetical protein